MEAHAKRLRAAVEAMWPGGAGMPGGARFSVERESGRKRPSALLLELP